MKFYKLRVDTNNKEKLKNLLMRYTEVYVIGLENGDSENPHCHVYLETNHRTDAIRMMIRKHYGSGNGVYSLKELDEKQPIEYISYCIKDNNYIHTLDTNFIEECKEWNTRIKTEIKTKKDNKTTILEKIIKHYDYENQQDIWIPTVIDNVLEYYKENKILVREFQIKSQVQTILLRYVPKYQRMFKNQLLQSITKIN